MIADAIMLSQAAVEGKLATRADASKHQGDYRKVVEGVNKTLDAVIGPLNVAAKYVDNISIGLIEASEILQATAANDYTRRVSGSDQRVKITDAYNGDFNTIKNNLNACIEALAGVGTATNQTADTLQASMKSIAQNSQALSSASQELAATSQQMSGNAEETSAQTNTVATATQQVTTNLNSVATGAEEMTSTVQSISSNAGEAAKVAGEAVKTANAANTTIAKLGESSAEIGQVIKVTTSIAQQTTLLAGPTLRPASEYTTTCMRASPDAAAAFLPAPATIRDRRMSGMICPRYCITSCAPASSIDVMGNSSNLATSDNGMAMRP